MFISRHKHENNYIVRSDKKHTDETLTFFDI